MGDAAEKQQHEEPSIDPNQVWFTTAEAAVYVRMKPKTLLKHVERGNLRADNQNSRARMSGFRFSRKTLNAFLGGE